MRRARVVAAMYPFTLAFQAKELEAAYWRRSLPSIRRRTRIGVAIVLFLYTAFGFLDPWIVPEAVTAIWTIRGINFCLCVVLLVLTGTRLFARAHQVIILSLPLLGGLGILMMLVLAGDAGRMLYYVGVILAIIWTMLFSELRFPLAVAASVYLVIGYEITLAIRPLPLPVIATNNFFVFATLLLAGSAGYTIEETSRKNFQQSLVIEQERHKSETLLLNILPREISVILKDRPGTIADRFEEASVLFADIVGFTILSARMSPEEMVQLLNEVFSFFDSLVDKYDLEKIRTIGDNYMVASGVPRPRPDHASALARMALDMRTYVCDGHTALKELLQFRIGINSGPVVAGVIGRRKFQYDIWGDTVNTASRMESNGVPGEIQITRNTFDLIKDDFVCRARGRSEFKGIGEMETWFLVDRRIGSASDPA